MSIYAARLSVISSSWLLLSHLDFSFPVVVCSSKPSFRIKYVINEESLLFAYSIDHQPCLSCLHHYFYICLSFMLSMILSIVSSKTTSSLLLCFYFLFYIYWVSHCPHLTPTHRNWLYNTEGLVATDRYYFVSSQNSHLLEILKLLLFQFSNFHLSQFKRLLLLSFIFYQQECCIMI